MSEVVLLVVPEDQPLLAAEGRQVEVEAVVVDDHVGGGLVSSSRTIFYNSDSNVWLCATFSAGANRTTGSFLHSDK